jgi:hypothetical protein
VIGKIREKVTWIVLEMMAGLIEKDENFLNSIPLKKDFICDILISIGFFK